MNPWKIRKGFSLYYCKDSIRTGIRIRFDKGVEDVLRSYMLHFVKWLRTRYEFPIRITIYIKNTYYIKARDKELVSATFLGPFDKFIEPYIKVAAGDFDNIIYEKGVFNALCAEICSIAHELTHYFQWVNDMEQSESMKEKQADKYSEEIVYDYLDECGYDYLNSIGVLK